MSVAIETVWADYGLSFRGTVTGIVGAPKFQCSDLIGFGNDYFEGYWAYVVWDADGAGAAPQGQKLVCTGYDSAGGDFTVAAFAPAIAVGDKVLLIHPSVAEVADIKTQTDPKVMGRLQVKATTVDLAQIGGTVADLFTATTQDVVVEKLVIRMSGGTLVGSNLTSILIQTDDATPIVLIDIVAGAVANLTNEAQLAWTGAILLDAGTSAKIQVTLNGGAATAAKVCDVIAECRAVVAGGYLT